MKKKSIIILSTIVAILLLATLIGPRFILMADRQEKKAESYAYSEVFFDEYDEVRNHLFETIDNLQNQGIHTEVYSHPIDREDGLYIDNIYLPSQGEKKNLVVITTGVHGIEGYIGSVMVDVFLQERNKK